jgi:hypothetical protein
MWSPESGHRPTELIYVSRCDPLVNSPAQDVKLGEEEGGAKTSQNRGRI